jgi:hypothetical protein
MLTICGCLRPLPPSGIAVPCSTTEHEVPTPLRGRAVEREAWSNVEHAVLFDCLRETRGKCTMTRGRFADATTRSRGILRMQ